MSKNRIRLSAVATILLAGVCYAAESDKFVIRGDAVGQILEQNSINVDTAERIGKACVDLAKKQAVKVSIVIYDQFGELVYLYRMDGQTRTAVEGAILKAKTVLNTRQPSKAAMNALLQGRTTELRQLMQFGGVAVGGGLPIVINDNQFIGAIGVGGSPFMPPNWSDELCAWKAMTAVMGPQAPLIPDLPRNIPPERGTGAR
jgi:uncharacterized protein GlcG (DUF336 family)